MSMRGDELIDKASALAQAEAAVRDAEERLARLRREAEAAGTDQSSDELQRLEQVQAQRIEKRNALFRDIADNDY